jgi:DNA-binding NarL/FixJ family response regulator
VADVGEACRLLRARTVRLSLAQLAEPEYVAAVRAARARVSVTILGARDNEATMREVIRMGARIIETDYPEVVARVRAL